MATDAQDTGPAAAPGDDEISPEALEQVAGGLLIAQPAIPPGPPNVNGAVPPGPPNLDGAVPPGPPHIPGALPFTKGRLF
jgi:hypothetical protein